MEKMVVVEGPNQGAVYQLTTDVVIGRSVEAQIRLNDTGVSRTHLRIYKANGKWFAKDLGSRNGFLLNGKQCTTESPISPGDTIQLSRTVMKFEVGDGTSVSIQTAPPDESEMTVATPAVQGDIAETIKTIRTKKQAVLNEVHKVIVGQDDIIESLLISLFSGGHCLLVGVPGLAKTLMVKTLAETMTLTFKRVQFTPDLMPSDITGNEVLQEDPQNHERIFKFIKGPVFTNILLADEINRAPPKTQASLLEAMQEFRVTAGGVTYSIPTPFFVLATQNPIEQEGTYPLPEAQLDRFMFMLKVAYPKRDEEMNIITKTTGADMQQIASVIGGNEILNYQTFIRKVPVSPYIVAYAADLVRASRPKQGEVPKFINDYVTWGAGPRAAQFMIVAAKTRAILSGRVNVSVTDIKTVAHVVMRHRIFTNFNADAEGITPDEIINRLLSTVPPPDEKKLSSDGVNS